MERQRIQKMKSFKTALIFLPLTLFLFLFSSHRATAQEDIFEKFDKVTIYFFWGDGCPHCENEKKFLAELKKKYPKLEVKDYEVWYNRENAKLFIQITNAYGTKPSGVPTTFIGDEIFVGFTENIAREIEDRLQYCLQRGCIDPIEKTIPSEQRKEKATITLPFFGKINVSKISLPVFTIIIAGLDSFNPCAFFVLFFLLSLLIHAHSRKRMFLIGGVFVFFSGFIYFLFMAAWLNLFLLLGHLVIITRIAGAIALIIAVINIKDFFFFQKGISLSISEKAKPKLFERMRNLLKSPSSASMITGTIVLAVAANTYELLCTAGFPMVFTRVLTLNNLSTLQYYLYLILYNIVYVIPLIAIVLIFTITLGTKKLTEWQGRILKLVSGLMMFLLGLILVIKPALLNNVFIAVGVLVISLILAGIIIVLTKKHYSA
jgi:thiol-disulfide isomerase/thioredoxin